MSDIANTHDRSLEVTIISGEDLRINDRPIKNNAFVTVKADSCCSPSSHDSTKPDARGESYPYWDEKLHVELPAGSRYIIAEVRRRSSSAGDKLVGTAWILVSDFVGDYTPENYLHFLSYRLRDAKGLRNGIINISVRVITSSCKGASSRPWRSPPSVLEFKTPVDREKNGGTVTGVPVCWKRRYERLMSLGVSGYGLV
ncbi:BON1-associated protein 1-like [Syzygium oleosum]|uniref:BON1-associated protein 1-like n=1 Tax=Syzygium oleosum TaxID=219896 RepID=UPI0024B903D6|nr:BON1-associated protein 1-like [Syzygium oleosum]